MDRNIFDVMFLFMILHSQLCFCLSVVKVSENKKKLFMNRVINYRLNYVLIMFFSQGKRIEVDLS